MLLSVLSGTLEVLVYSSDELQNLRPVYGGAPCAEDHHHGSWSENSLFEATDANTPTSGVSPNEDMQTEQQISDEEQNDELDEAVALDGAMEAVAGRVPKPSDSWLHEPRFCAHVWPVNDGDDPGEARVENSSPV